MKKFKHLIIGAGITGLTFANFLDSEDYVILEKESEPGGYCKTIIMDEYIWDYAGHFFHFALKETKNYFEQKILKSDFVEKIKNTKILYKGKYIDYPFQKNIHQLNKNEFIDCLYDIFNKDSKTRYDNFQDMLYGKYGKSITNKFLKPYNEKLYACNLNDLDVNAMGRFFPHADNNEIIRNMKIHDDNSYNKTFLYPKRGAFIYVDALLSSIAKDKVLYNQEVIKIDLLNKIAYTRTDHFGFKYIINTSPFINLIKAIDYNLFEKNKKTFSYNKVLVFNLGFDRKSHITDVHWTYVPDKNINFYRYGFYDNILDSNKLSMYTEIGFESDANIDINKELSLTINNLKKIGIIKEHELVAYSSVVMEPAYVHISNDSNKMKRIIKGDLESKNIYTIGRYGDWKYCSIEDSMQDAIKLAKKLTNKEAKKIQMKCE